MIAVRYQHHFKDYHPQQPAPSSADEDLGADTVIEVLLFAVMYGFSFCG